MTDEEFVRQHWKEVHPANMFIFLGACTDGNAVTSWAAAAEFTRERLEDIRQLERDADGVARTVQMLGLKLVAGEGDCVSVTRAYHSSCRIHARLNVALSALKEGMQQAAEEKRDAETYL